MNVKFGLLKFSTENIGDEIQSIAVRRFLPSIDYYFDRDDIDSTTIKKEDTVKIIMSSWYMAKPDNWPPKNDKINPLLISMYIERDNPYNKTNEAFLSEGSRKYIEMYGPLGARDTGTEKFLKENGIDSYFSGCTTLTLIPDKSIKKQEFVLAVDVSENVLSKIRRTTDRRVIVLNTERYRWLNREEKERIAEYWLSIYQAAHCVVTTRLHCMLPCLAFGTPVYAIDKDDMRRYGGLLDLCNHYSESDFMRRKLSFDKPKQNPKKYLAIKRKLEKRVSNFTGYDSEQSFLGDRHIDSLLMDADFISAINKIAEKSYISTLRNEESKKEIERLSSIVEELDNEKESISTPGIKQSSKFFAKAICRRISRTFKK